MYLRGAGACKKHHVFNSEDLDQFQKQYVIITLEDGDCNSNTVSNICVL